MPAPHDPLTWLRALCTALGGVEETPAWGHPNFRAGGRTFAVYEVIKGRPTIAVQAEPGAQDLFVDQFGFFKTPYLGHRGWVSVWVDGPVPWELLEDLVTKAHSFRSTLRSRSARTHEGPTKRKAARAPLRKGAP